MASQIMKASEFENTNEQVYGVRKHGMLVCKTKIEAITIQLAGLEQGYKMGYMKSWAGHLVRDLEVSNAGL